MKLIETIKEKIERLLSAAQHKEQANRRKSALAYAPIDQDRFQRAAEQDARNAADLNDQLGRR